MSALPFSGAAFGQTGSIQGTVTDDGGRTLPGVNVTVQGTATGAATDSEGTYRITGLEPGTYTLRATFVGFQAGVREGIEVSAGDTTTVDFTLQPATTALEDVVVVGYTEQERETVAGAVSSISSEEIAERSVGTLEEALKGQVAGVDIQATGEPGANSSVVIRGLSFTSGSNSPLYVVDGVYTDQSPNLDPSQIESIQVLKDASAAAQYGAQAANGVIVIETKEGNAGKTEISASGFYGTQAVPNKIDMMESQEWAEVARNAYENAGQQPPDGALNPEEYATTDWQDALLRRAPVQKYNASVSGGSKNASYLISGGYLNRKGTVIQTSFERYNLRINSEIERGIFTFGEKASFSRSIREHMDGFPLIDALRMLPTIPVRDSSNVGGYGFGSTANPTFGTNPIGAQRTLDDVAKYNRAIGNLYVEADILDNLTARVSGGGEYEDLRYDIFDEQALLRFNNTLQPADLTVGADDTYDLQGEAQLTFDDTFGQHSIKATSVYREQWSHFKHVEAYREGFSNEKLRVINAGTMNAEVSGNASTHTLRSFLVRANYNYGGRYLFSGSVRRDGSSRFGPNNRWGTFAAGSVGWVLSEEPYYDAVPILSDYVNFFKIRASYGELGNQDIGNYAFAATITQNLNYGFGPEGRLAPGAIQTTLSNPNIKWQENQQTNIGVNIGLFDDALTIDANYYISTSDDLLVQAPIPPSLGAQGTPTVNAGSIRNSGFEFSLTQEYSGDELNIQTQLNLTTINNEVLSLGNNSQPIFAGPFGVSRTAVGGEIGELYVLKTDGLFQSEQEVQNHTSTVDGQEVLIQPDAQPGDIRFVDRNGDGQIGDDDRYVAGSPFPDFQGGLSFNFKYGNVDFSMSLRGSYGNEIFNVPRYWTNRMDDLGGFRESLDPWTPEDPNTNTPRAVIGAEGSMNATVNSDRWVEDGSYLRIQSAKLGYTFPSGLFDQFGLSDGSLRIYVSVDNLYTLTGYSNWDPAIGGSGILARAVDDGNIYPEARTIAVGLDLSL
ncbi:MAG: SusC/RagA family TonB-linked outer membrane protein [Salinibacter sp.]